MTAAINFNPFGTYNAPNSFMISSQGLWQGNAFPDPAIRYSLRQGILSYSETLPIWGGVVISDIVPNPGVPDNIINPGTLGNPQPALGGQISRATNVTGGATAGSATGLTVFDQAHSWLNYPGSPVPLGASGQFVPYYYFGSGARVPVAVDPALASLEGGLTTQPVSWDFTNQRLIPYVAAYSANVLTAQTWATTGGGTVTFTTTTAHGLSVGSDFTISGSSPAGYNGSYTAITGTTGSTIKAALASNPGSSTAYGQLNAGGGALPIQRVLQLEIGNSYTVSYNPVTGQATWNRQGAAALILL